MSIDQTDVDAALTAAQEAAGKIGIPMNIAILDDGANLKAFLRMDGALLGSIDVAMRKARASALFGMTSADVGELSKPDGAVPGLAQSNGGLIGFAGGVPIKDGNGKVIGAIGASGGAAQQDLAVALAAATAVNERLTAR